MIIKEEMRENFQNFFNNNKKDPNLIFTIKWAELMEIGIEANGKLDENIINCCLNKVKSSDIDNSVLLYAIVILADVWEYGNELWYIYSKNLKK